MEIHPPEHPIHSWPDFFIHMGTIVLGVIIAIGFEQAKDDYHHRQDVRQLQQDLRAEAESNVSLLGRNLTTRLPDEIWVHRAIAALFDAKAKNGLFTVKLPDALPNAPNVGIFDTVELPSRGVWTVAKTNGQVALLGTDEAKAYNRLDYNGEKYLDVSDMFSATENEAYGLEERLRIELKPGKTLVLKPGERDEVLRTFAELLGHLNKLNQRTSMWEGAAQAIAAGARTTKDMSPYIKCAQDSIAEGKLVPEIPPCPLYRPRK